MAFLKSGINVKDKSKLWIWGSHAVKAALKNQDRHIYRVLATKAASQTLETDLKVEIVDPQVLQKIVGPQAVHQGVAVEVSPLDEVPLESLRDMGEGVVLVLDQVTDPHNVGAILRTARALGALGVVMTERNAPPLSGALAKSASGALESLLIWKVTNLSRTLDDLKEMGFWTVGLDEKARDVIGKIDFPQKLALIMGAEGEGLRRLTQEKCDFLVKLATDPTFPTLNVSIATALALSACLKKN